jgi:hypothetical protein
MTASIELLESMKQAARAVLNGSTLLMNSKA